MIDHVTNAETADATWKSLYRVGGTAALIAGVIFRRNLGPEIWLISGHAPPVTVIDWFTLLQNNKLLGLSLLNLFDIVDYALVGLMFLPSTLPSDEPMKVTWQSLRPLAS